MSYIHSAVVAVHSVKRATLGLMGVHVLQTGQPEAAFCNTLLEMAFQGRLCAG